MRPKKLLIANAIILIYTLGFLGLSFLDEVASFAYQKIDLKTAQTSNQLAQDNNENVLDCTQNVSNLKDSSLLALSTKDDKESSCLFASCGVIF